MAFWLCSSAASYRPDPGKLDVLLDGRPAEVHRSRPTLMATRNVWSFSPFLDTYAPVCANSHACVSCLSLPSSSVIGKQITDVVTSGGQRSTKFVLRTIGVCSRRWTFAVPVTLTVS